MLTTNVLPWLRRRRIIIMIAAFALAVSLAFASIGNSWTANAAPDDAPVVAEEVMTLAGPTWTYGARLPVPGDFFGPTWG